MKFLKFIFGVVKWLLLTTVLLIVLVLAVLAYFTATETGYRQLPRVISAISPYNITYQSLNGTFWTHQTWRGLSVQGPSLDFKADSLVLDNTSGISPARVAFADIQLIDAEIALADSQKEDTPTTIPKQLPQIDLPFDIALDRVHLENVQVLQQGKSLIDIHDATLNALYQHGHLTASADLTSDVADGNLQAAVTTLDDYPLNLDTTVTLHNMAQMTQTVFLQAQGSVLQPHVTVNASGYADADAVITGNIALAEERLDADVQWQRFVVGDLISSDTGHLRAYGPFSRIALAVETDLRGDGIPQADINAQATLSPNAAEDIALRIAALDGVLTFNGAVAFAPVISWQGQLTATDINGAAYQSDLDLVLNADIATEGQLSTSEQHAVLAIHDLQGRWQGYPLLGHGALRYEHGQINAEDFHLNLAGNVVNAQGALGEQNSALEITLLADQLNNLTPALDGDINAHALLTGNAIHPNIEGKIDWTGLSYQPNDVTPLFSSKLGQLSFTGTPDALNIIMAIDAHGRDFPQTHVQGSATASAERIANMDVQLHSGESRANIAGDVTLKPNIAWDVTVETQQFDPSQFVSDYPGSMNANIDSTGHIATNGDIAVSASINKLDGLLLNQPLAGQGDIHYDQTGIRADQLNLTIAGNHIDVNGALGQQDNSLKLNIDAQALGALLPELSGGVAGQATLQGALDDPFIDTDLRWRDLSYRDKATQVLLVASREGRLQAKGNLSNGVDVQTTLTASGADFPESHLDGSAHVTPERISDMDMTLTSGEGMAQVRGAVTLKPDIAWDVSVNSKNFDPSRFVPEYQGNINADIDSQGHVAAGDVVVSATINQLNGTLLNQPLNGQGNLHYDKQGIRAEQLMLNVAGNHINANGQLNQQGGALTLDIDADKLGALMPNLSGAVNGQATLTGAIDAPDIDADLSWQNLHYTDKTTQSTLFASPQGQLQANGNLEEGLQIATNLRASGQNFPESHVTGRAHVTPEQIDNIDLTLTSSEGSAGVTGQVTLKPDVAWDITLRSNDLNPARFAPDYPGNINAHIDSQGKIAANGDISATANIHQLSGTLLDQPLRGQGNIHYDQNGVRAEQLILNVADNRIEANGRLDQTGGALTLDIDADKLGALVPSLSGAVNGRTTLTGAINNPDIQADLQWQNLRYSDNASKTALFDSTKGTLQAQGNIKDGLIVQTDLTASGQGFPQSRLHGGAHVTPQRISDIDLTLQQGEGSAHLTGQADLQPNIKWNVDLKTNNFNPGAFAEGYEGKVNADISSTGRIDPQGKINAKADIHSISGTLNGEPLSGEGSILLEDGALNMQEVALGLGQNKVAVRGGYRGGQFDLQFDLEGRNLSTFYPPLSGTLDAKGSIKGSAEQPDIALTASAANIKYQDYHVKNADIRLNSGMHQGGAFDNTVQLNGVDLAGQRWQSITLATDGRFNQHTIQFATRGGEYNLALAAKGGLESLQRWAGDITTLTAEGNGLNWRLQQASAIVISPQQQRINNFCLGDGISGLCVDINRDEQTNIAYRIDKLSPKSFAAFIPDSVRTSITAQGKGDVQIAANGAMSGNAEIHLTPGNLMIAPPDSPPVSLNLVKGSINAAFKGQQANIASDIAFAKAGEVHLRAKINDFTSPRLDGELALNIPDIGEFRYLVPSVSDMQGSINGNLRFSGAASNPAVGGQIALAGGYIVIPEYATELQDIRLQLSAAQTGRIDITGQVGTPKGALNINGALGLAPLRLNLNLDGKNMLIANAEDMRVVITPSFDVIIDPDTGIVVDGKVTIPEASISIPDTSRGVSVSKDVVIVGKHEKSTQEKLKETKTPFNARIGVELGDKVYFDNADVSLRLIGGITIIMRPNRPITGEGTISVASGIYELYGQELDIKRGRVIFSGGNIANPAVEVLALREIGDVNVGAQINGNVEQLHLTLTSTPTMPDSAILSYLLFGRAPDAGTDTNALLQTAASFTLGGVFPDDLSQKAGLDVLDIGVTGLKAGKYLGDDLYVGMQSNFFNAMTEFIARYQFSKRLKAEATANGQSNAIDFIYEFETN